MLGALNKSALQRLFGQPVQLLDERLVVRRILTEVDDRSILWQDRQGVSLAFCPVERLRDRLRE